MELCKKKGELCDDLIKRWPYEYLWKGGIIAMVKEGVFINESLQHLKQFLLLRAGKVKSLIQLRRRKQSEPLKFEEVWMNNEKVRTPDDLPIVNKWQTEEAERAKASKSESKKDRKKREDIVGYSPKQFIHADVSVKFSPKLGDHPKIFQAKNDLPLMSTARCALGWPRYDGEGKAPTAKSGQKTASTKKKAAAKKKKKKKKSSSSLPNTTATEDQGEEQEEEQEDEEEQEEEGELINSTVSNEIQLYQEGGFKCDGNDKPWLVDGQEMTKKDFDEGRIQK